MNLESFAGLALLTALGLALISAIGAAANAGAPWYAWTAISAFLLFVVGIISAGNT